MKVCSLEKVTCGNCLSTKNVVKSLITTVYFYIAKKKFPTFDNIFYVDLMRGLHKYAFLSYLKDRTSNPAVTFCPVLFYPQFWLKVYIFG